MVNLNFKIITSERRFDCFDLLFLLEYYYNCYSLD